MSLPIIAARINENRVPLVDRRSRSPKMKRYLYRLYRLRGMTIKAAGAMAGYSDEYIRSRGYRVEARSKVGIEEAFDRAGLTDNVLASEVTRIAFGAKKVQACDVYIQNENGRWVVNQNSSDFIDIDDERTRLEALKLAAVLKKHVKPNGNGNGHGGQVVQVIVKFPEEVAHESLPRVEVKKESDGIDSNETRIDLNS